MCHSHDFILALSYYHVKLTVLYFKVIIERILFHFNFLWTTCCKCVITFDNMVMYVLCVYDLKGTRTCKIVCFFGKKLYPLIRL